MVHARWCPPWVGVVRSAGAWARLHHCVGLPPSCREVAPLPFSHTQRRGRGDAAVVRVPPRELDVQEQVGDERVCRYRFLPDRCQFQKNQLGLGSMKSQTFALDFNQPVF